MYIQSLELKNYRNYKELKFDFSKKINILYGDNAQGKTNILEALYLCATTKSHRSNKDKELIKFDESESHIKTHLSKNGIIHKIDIHLRCNKTKGVAIDGMPIRKSSDLFGMLNIIFFSPEDLGLIKRGPSERRRFIDMELCQLDKIYFSNLSNYNKTINHRNNLLKQSIAKPELLSTIDIWDAKLVEYGIDIIKRRRNFLLLLNEKIQEIHKRLSGNKEELILKYEPNILEKEFLDSLVKKRKGDLRCGITQVGPHRDDIQFFINNQDIKKYGSQGQQRTAALSLKLAEIELVRQIIKDTPILLLDDVLSELDNNRKKYLLDSISDIQTIITCTGVDEFIQDRIKFNKVVEVKEGTIKEKN